MAKRRWVMPRRAVQAGPVVQPSATQPAAAQAAELLEKAVPCSNDDDGGGSDEALDDAQPAAEPQPASQQHQAPQLSHGVQTATALAALPTATDLAVMPPMSGRQPGTGASNRDEDLGNTHAATAAEPPAAAAAEALAAAAEVLHEQQRPPAEAGATSQLPLDVDARVRSDYGQLKSQQASARGLAWSHLEPLLVRGAQGLATAAKLRCKHCGRVFSGGNPSRTVKEHLPRCAMYAGPALEQAASPPRPPKRARPDPTSQRASEAAEAGAAAAVTPAAAATAYFRPNPEPRQQPLRPGAAALLFVDTQNFNCHPRGALGSKLQGSEYSYYWGRVAAAAPLWGRLAAAARAAGLEVMYTVIQSLTADGRDRGLDYKLSGFHVPPGCWDALVLPEVQPGPDEIVLPKTSSSVFGSTSIAWLLRNLGVSQLAVCGAVTDQCVEHAVRDAADAGFYVTEITDACVTQSEERHSASLRAVAGYCRQRTTAELLAELQELPQK